MKEAEASEGTKLHALVVSMLAGMSFSTALSKVEEQSGPSWDAIADNLKRGLVVNMPSPDQPFQEPYTGPHDA